MITCIVVKIIVGTDFQEQLQTVQIERKRNRREKREKKKEKTRTLFSSDYLSPRITANRILYRTRRYRKTPHVAETPRHFEIE